MIKILFYLLIVTLISCNSHYNAQLAPSVDSPIEEKNEESKVIDGIVFLTFKINKDPNNNTNKISHIGTIKTEGTLKNNSIEPVNSQNTLNIEIFINGILDQNIVINHPLYKSLEYLNENKSFSRKEVELDEAEFSIRITNKTSEKTIIISETLRNKTKKEKYKFKL
jgi:hypothetical protein